ncbi:hypothetical protein GTW98_19760 [Streptomyces sp. SID8375]|nr:MULTISPECIES: hypothetical protein [unclassified Streptomyces]MYT11557.1 hypothetical protein [Streptomyces sp. SID4951]MYX09013.1 hypothetical protein [Streptomyces sp. SID8375]SCK10817.1 hypothetical protein YWIDRAFT_00770 [Streptomyces sp. SceaMP-e96]
MGIRHRIVPLAAALALTGGLAATEAAPALAAHPASGRWAASSWPRPTS